MKSPAVYLCAIAIVMLVISFGIGLASGEFSQNKDLVIGQMTTHQFSDLILALTAEVIRWLSAALALGSTRICAKSQHPLRTVPLANR
jgi:hypothetical protein